VGEFYHFAIKTYGAFFEKVAVEEGLSGWAVTMGGSSDTRIWAEHGIQSVNLSAGYRNEHTEEEFLDVMACYQTTKLLKGIFMKGNELKGYLRKINPKHQEIRNYRRAQ
jgi:tripeptide aminopeptidase